MSAKTPNLEKQASQHQKLVATEHTPGDLSSPESKVKEKKKGKKGGMGEKKKSSSNVLLPS